VTDEPFEMVVEETWHLPSVPALIAIGTIRSGMVRVGDGVVLTDEMGDATATVVGIDFHVPPPQTGLVLGDLDVSRLRAGQIIRARTK
jgi:hypothetical protein